VDIQNHSRSEIDALIAASSTAQRAAWQSSGLQDRMALCERVATEMEQTGSGSWRDAITQDISKQMGKPLSQAVGEVNTAAFRTHAMLELAPEALADCPVTPLSSSAPAAKRKLTKEPVGTVFVIAPWNYPLITAMNCIVPAVLAGNSVIVKHSSRSPTIAEHIQDLFARCGAPQDLVRFLHASHDDVAYTMAQKSVGYVHFTGSVPGGHQVYASAAQTRFIDVGLELGGKDPMYVCEDGNVKRAAESAVDGSMYNAGQSCCGVERVYVRDEIYDEFVAASKTIVESYVLGDPMDEATQMGPMASASSLPFLQEQVQEAVAKGATLLVGGAPCSDAQGKGRFFAPTLLVDCTHEMSVMRDESFGPIMAVQRVSSDEEAVQLMNDSEFGLTASVWTADAARAEAMAPQIETGTVFMNGCDYVDPYLGWCGVKDTGKGVSLSKHAFDAVTRLKSYHFRE
jgi:acyl-CoA reductase-like NAD-dependent aldehyde dehydrogenase